MTTKNEEEIKLLDDALALVRDHRLVAMVRRMNQIEISLMKLRERLTVNPKHNGAENQS